MTDVAHLRELAGKLSDPNRYASHDPVVGEASAALVQAATQIEMLQKQIEAVNEERDLFREQLGLTRFRLFWMAENESQNWQFYRDFSAEEVASIDAFTQRRSDSAAKSPGR